MDFDVDLDLNLAKKLLDTIVSNTHSKRLEYVTIDVGDFKHLRSGRQQFLDLLSMRGFETQRLFEFSRTDSGTFACVNWGSKAWPQ
jgi:hypothetical protein